LVRQAAATCPSHRPAIGYLTTIWLGDARDAKFRHLKCCGEFVHLISILGNASKQR